MAEDNKKSDAAAESDELDKPSTIIEPEKAADVKADGQQQSSKPGSEAELSDSNSTSASSTPTLRFRRFVSISNAYFLIFLLLLLLAAGGVFAAVKLSKSPKQETTTTQSLTDKQLAELKGSTTVIGDSQQVLDVQSNAIFEETVLMRNNLDVAGTVKVGGPLSLSAVTVGGTSSFGQVQITGPLSVSGAVTLQNSLTVAGGGSFSGTLSASQLNVTNLQLTGNLVVSRHLAGGGGTPSRTNGSALGSGGTASVNGTDTAGTVTINTGGGPPAGCFVTINFVQAFGATPHVVISPSNSSAAGLDYYTNRTTTNFSVCTANAPAASTSYLFDYIAFD